MPDIVQGFLSDIVAHPDDPSLWLILADWLEDQNDPRAELVRLTWQLPYEPDHADFAARQARLQALLAAGMIPVRPRCTLGGIEFAWIPPGTFLMGSPATEKDRQDNETQHRVTLTQGFWMGVTPVTQGQWQTVMGENPSYFSRSGDGKVAVAKVSDADLARFPVEQVSWNMAEDFCQKLSQRVGSGVVLPTEGEWEYACRAGTTSPFHFGSVLNGHQANCDGNYPYGTDVKGPNLRTTRPVGCYPCNAWGLHDMHGNVWEWCSDGYDEAAYSSNNRIDPFIRADNSEAPRVLRGGSWNDDARNCRAAYRFNSDPAFRNGYIGFRFALRLD